MCKMSGGWSAALELRLYEHVVAPRPLALNSPAHSRLACLSVRCAYTSTVRHAPLARLVSQHQSASGRSRPLLIGGIVTRGRRRRRATALRIEPTSALAPSTSSPPPHWAMQPRLGGRSAQVQI